MKNSTREIEENTAKAWLKTGAIVLTDCGSENSYFVNEFGARFFCKDYPWACANPITHEMASFIAEGCALRIHANGLESILQCYTVEFAVMLAKRHSAAACDYRLPRGEWIKL